jgi:formylglycine-generating enzyme required for sulfatase activity
MSEDPSRTVPRISPATEQTADSASPGGSRVRAAHESPTDPDDTVSRAPGETPPTEGTIVQSPEDAARLAEGAWGGTEAVPGFVLLGELGRGGMGVVYKATQTGLGRTVALKMLIAGPYADPALRARFLLEAESVAALEHPRIVRVFAFGESGGHPYLAMEFVSGGSLAERLKARGPLPPREAAELVATLAEAVAHAHSRGVVHRDIKPANVLLTAENELRLADFGLAKVGRSDLSETGQVMGTPAYMAPEQAAGKIHEIGTAADVYALGAVLYDLLTGRPPFYGDSALVTLQKVLTLDPDRPRSLRSDIPRDLETICLKCLEKLPNKRYATADMLAADLRAFLDGRPITARPVGATERAWKWVKRNPGRAGAIAAAVLVLVGGAVAAYGVREQRAADQLAAEKQRADDRIAAEEHRLAALRTAEEQARQKQRETRASDLVDALATADTAGVSRLIDDLKEYRDLLSDKSEAASKLTALTRQPITAKPGLHARLARLGNEPNRATELAAYLPTCRADELLTLRQLLKPHAATVSPALWGVLTDEKAESGNRVRAASALTGLTPDDARWNTVAPVVTELVVRENPLQVVVWAQALDPVRGALLAPLMKRYSPARDRIRSGKLDESALVAEAAAFDLTANLLARYALDRPAELAELAMTVDARHYTLFRDSIRANKAAVVPILRAELARNALPKWAGSGEIVSPLAALGGAPAVADILDPDALFDALAKRQGNAAATLLTLGEGESAWLLFAFPKNGDPGARSYLIQRLAAIGADPAALVRRFGAETDVSARRAILIALGDFPVDLVPPGEREPLVARLLALYRDDADVGLHSAIDWLLRQKWDKAKEITAIDAELAAARGRLVLVRGLASAGQSPPFGRMVGPLLPAPPVGKKDWYVNGEGQTYAVVRGPVEFTLGSPLTEPDRVVINEPPHRKRLKRSFAIGTKEVTNEQYLRFRADQFSEKRYSPDPDSPMVSVNWYDCAAYCNWLSAREGIPENEWCYTPNKNGKYDAGMMVKAGYLTRTGYRLPTEVEWEYACRAGTVTSRYYGRSGSMLTRYGWVLANADTHAWPVGQLRPNDLGLFDTLGNALEWTEDPGGLYVTNQLDDQEDPNEIITDRLAMVLRGGLFIGEPQFLRSAARTASQPGNRFNSNGFRLARTLPRE